VDISGAGIADDAMERSKLSASACFTGPPRTIGFPQRPSAV
jgi:hypothetical protein